MIKRSGVEIMNARTKNVSLAKETLDVLKKKQYTAPSGNIVDLSSALDNAIKGTKLYSSNTVYSSKTVYHVPTIEVFNETTAQSATRLLANGKDKLVALNFASARNVGGGFLAGALAQEEDLCRASGLYVCTKSKPIFYNENILSEGRYYTDNIIYSPDVPFFRDEESKFLEQPFSLSIISSPAPNLMAAKNINKDEVMQVLLGRAKKILQVAHTHGHKNIILGAWGCGAFGNDPITVATAFSKALKDVPLFNHVCFAVYDTREPPFLYETFKDTFK